MIGLLVAACAPGSQGVLGQRFPIPIDRAYIAAEAGTVPVAINFCPVSADGSFETRCDEAVAIPTRRAADLGTALGTSRIEQALINGGVGFNRPDLQIFATAVGSGGRYALADSKGSDIGGRYRLTLRPRSATRVIQLQAGTVYVLDVGNNFTVAQARDLMQKSYGAEADRLTYVQAEIVPITCDNEFGSATCQIAPGALR